MDEFENKSKHDELKEENDNFLEEIAYEFTPGLKEFYQSEKSLRQGFIYGMLGIFFSLLSLYLFPILTGIVGLFFGYRAVVLGATVMGYTAIGFSAFTIIVALFLYI